MNRPSRLLLSALVGIDLLLLLAHVSGFVIRGEPFLIFNLDAEANLPTWWSSTKFAMAGTLMMVMVLKTEFRKLTPILLGLLFFAFSLDEAVSLHERLGHFFADHVATGSTIRRKDAFLWPVLFGIPALLCIGIVFRWLRKEGFMSASLWRDFAIAIVVLFTGAVGMEVVAFNPLVSIPQTSGVYETLSALEEMLEHLGASLLVWASYRVMVQGSLRKSTS